MSDYVLDLRKLVGNMPLVTSVAGCIIVDEKNRILLQHRVDNDSWSIPGGVVEPGESVEETVVREVYEETNLQVNHMDFFKIYSGEHQHYIYPNGDEVYFVNAVYISREYTGTPTVDNVENKNIKFWDLNELPQISPSNQIILDEFADHLSLKNSDITIREFIIEEDDIEQLTILINNAYKQLADMGFKYLATHQDAQTTLRRIKQARCLVAFQEGQIIGTISYYPPHLKKGCDWYDQDTVATIGQFGVKPALQSKGLGDRLLSLAEEMAIEDQAEKIALDTAEGARHLIGFYGKRGYIFVDYVSWEVTNYRSVIMSKDVT